VLAYAILFAVFERAAWWQAIARSARETLRHPFSSLATVALSLAGVLAFMMIANPYQVAHWMAQVRPEIVLGFVAGRWLLWHVASAVLVVAVAHLWCFHHVPASALRSAAPGATAPRLQAQAACVAALLLLVGCSADYTAERLYWNAQRVRDAAAQDPGQIKFDAVQSAFESVIARGGGTVWAARAQLAIGQLWQAQGQHALAREAYQLVVYNYSQYAGMSLEARAAIAASFAAEGRWAEASTAYGELATYHPWSVPGLEAPLAVAAETARRDPAQAEAAYERAAKRYEQMASQAPTLALRAQAQGYLAVVQHRRGRPDESMRVLEELMTKNASPVNRPLLLLTLSAMARAQGPEAARAAAAYERMVRSP
jgi:hypothetical protein